VRGMGETGALTPYQKRKQRAWVNHEIEHQLWRLGELRKNLADSIALRKEAEERVARDLECVNACRRDLLKLGFKGMT
jgi:hypothetical protein